LFTTVAGNHTATINGIYYTKKGNWGGQIDIRTSYNWGYSGVDNARISLNGLADNGITFSTGASATGSVERMRIDYAGNVLIGVTSSFTIGGTAKVSIYADAPFTYGLTSTDAIYFRRYGVGQYQFQTTESGGNNGNLSLQSYGGNVGIGTTSTATKLTIGAYEGSRLPYINGTATTFNADGITVTSYNTGNAGVGGGLDQ
jgi:hypothetical protein